MAAAITRCGSDEKASHDGEEASVANPVTPASPNATKLIRGRLVLGANALAAHAWHVWLVNHSQAGVHSLTCDQKGNFYLPLYQLNTTHHYGLHIVNRQGHYLGPIDLNPGEEGVQAHFKLSQTQHDLELGVATLSLDQAGEPTSEPASFAVSPATEALSLAEAANGAINELPLPSGITSLHWTSSLGPTTGSALREAFYQRTLNPQAYQKNLARFSYDSLQLQLASTVNMYRAFVAESGPWLDATRQRSPLALLPPEGEPFWLSNNFGLSLRGAGTWQAHSYGGRYPAPERDALVVHVQLRDGTLYKLPRVLARSTGYPPQVNAWALNANAWTALRYDSLSEVNGLARAFVLGAATNLRVRVQPPQNTNGEAYGHAAMQSLQVRFAYFKVDGGVETQVSSSPTNFPASLQNRLEAADATAQATVVWDPNQTSLTFTWDGGSETPSAGDEISLASDYFLFAASELAVSRVRVNLRYESADGQQGEAFFWVEGR